MSRQPTTSSSGRNQLAAEYALGVLEGREFAEARRLIATDPEFASATEAKVA